MCEADADSPKRERSGGESHYGYDKDNDDRCLFALDGRRFYTDLRIIRSRHANPSVERPRTYGVRQNVKGDCVQSGMGRFADRSWRLHGVALANCDRHVHRRARQKAANRFQGQNGSLIVMLRSSGAQRNAFRHRDVRQQSRSF